PVPFGLYQRRGGNAAGGECATGSRYGRERTVLSVRSEYRARLETDLAARGVVDQAQSIFGPPISGDYRKLYDHADAGTGQTGRRARADRTGRAAPPYIHGRTASRAAKRCPYAAARLGPRDKESLGRFARRGAVARQGVGRRGDAGIYEDHHGGIRPATIARRPDARAQQAAAEKP